MNAKFQKGALATFRGCGKSYWHLSYERSRLAPTRRSYEGNPFDDWGSFVIALPRGSEAARFV